MHVLSAHSSDWRPVRLKDAASVEHLNELFADGWFLMPLGVDGLSVLAFSVPAEPVRASERRMIWQRDQGALPETISIVVLRRGSRPDRQRAVLTTRDAGGYLDMGSIEIASGWSDLITLQLEDDGLVTVIERDEFSSGDVAW